MLLTACLSTFSAQAQQTQEPGPESAAPQGSEPDAGGVDEQTAVDEETTADEQSDADAQTEPTGEEGTDDPVPESEEEASEDVSEPEPPPSVDPTASDDPDYYTTPDPFVPSLRTTEYEEPKKPPYTGPFRAGQISLGLSIGFQATAEQTWFVPGVGVGYFLVHGLQVRVDTDFWIGDPFIATPSPGLEYVFWMLPVVNPYVGGFYRHYFVGDGYLDADSVGARGGLYILTGKRSYFGGGVVYERILQDHLFAEQDLIYPEITFVFSF